MQDTPQGAAAQQDAPLKASKLATSCLAIFLLSAALEVVPIAAAKVALAPLPKSAGESFAFSLIIAFSIMGGMALQLVSSALSLALLRRTRWKDVFGYVALACNAVMFILFLVL